MSYSHYSAVAQIEYLQRENHYSPSLQHRYLMRNQHGEEDRMLYLLHLSPYFSTGPRKAPDNVLVLALRVTTPIQVMHEPFLAIHPSFLPFPEHQRLLSCVVKALRAAL
jgi:hypothetical protein